MSTVQPVNAPSQAAASQAAAPARVIGGSDVLARSRRTACRGSGHGKHQRPDYGPDRKRLRPIGCGPSAAARTALGHRRDSAELPERSVSGHGFVAVRQCSSERKRKRSAAAFLLRQHAGNRQPDGGGGQRRTGSHPTTGVVGWQYGHRHGGSAAKPRSRPATAAGHNQPIGRLRSSISGTASGTQSERSPADGARIKSVVFPSPNAYNKRRRGCLGRRSHPGHQRPTSGPNTHSGGHSCPSGPNGSGHRSAECGVRVGENREIPPRHASGQRGTGAGQGSHWASSSGLERLFAREVTSVC